MKLVALKRLRYPRGPAGQEYSAGDAFETASDRDAKALTLVRAARAATAADQQAEPKVAAAAQGNLLATASIEAEQAGTASSETPPRRYRRRDLRPQE